MIKVCFFCFFLITCSVGFSQISFLDSDRPSFSLTPHPLQKNQFQAELGYLRTVEWLSGKNKVSNILLPELVARYGTGKRFELRTGVSINQEKRKLTSGNSSSPLYSQVMGGFKYKLTKQRKIIPTITIMPSLFYKLNNVRTKSFDTLFDYSIKFLFENIVNEHFLLRYAFGFERVELFNPNKKFTYSITPTYTFDDSWRLYLELHGFKRPIPNERMAHFIASGLQYAVSNKMKFDISSGYNIGRKKPEKSSDDFYYGAGISYRFN